MRKLLIPVTMMMLAAMILAACSGAVTPVGTTGTSVPVTGGTAGAGTATVGGTSIVPSTGATTGATANATAGIVTGTGTAAPTMGATVSATTGAATEAVTVAPTTSTGGTGAGVGTGTPAANTVGTPSSPNAGSTATSDNAGAGTATMASGAGEATTAPTASTTGTPAAATGTGTPAAGTSGSTGSTGSTGTNGSTTPFTQGQLVKLSDILQSTVSGSDNAQVGRVVGLLIERPVLPGEGQPTPAANQPTATLAPTLSAPQQVFVRYIMVNVSGTAAGQSSSAGTSQSGNQVVIPWQAVSGNSSAQSLSLNMSASDLAAAPHTTLLDVASGNNAWMPPLASYWSGKGLSIPATGANNGAQATTSMIFIPRERGGIDITDVKGTAIGQASDLLIDARTGEIMYVVFPNSPTANNQTVAVPMRLLTWTLGQGAAEIVNRGALSLNFDASVLQNFPNLGNLSNLATDPNVLNQLNNFWNSIQGSGTSK